MLALEGGPRFFAEGRLITFTLRTRGKAITCAVTRDALERHFLQRRTSDERTLLSVFERGLKRILEAADKKSRVLRGSRILLTAHDLGDA